MRRQPQRQAGILHAARAMRPRSPTVAALAACALQCRPRWRPEPERLPAPALINCRRQNGVAHRAFRRRSGEKTKMRYPVAGSPFPSTHTGNAHPLGVASGWEFPRFAGLAAHHRRDRLSEDRSLLLPPCKTGCCGLEHRRRLYAPPNVTHRKTSFRSKSSLRGAGLSPQPLPASHRWCLIIPLSSPTTGRWRVQASREGRN